MKNIIYSLILVTIITACSPSESAVQTALSQTQAAAVTPTPTYQPCLTESVRADITTLIQQFQNIEEIASSTPRISLSPVILDLNDIRNNANVLILPECASSLKPLIVSYMDSIIAAYSAFQAQNSTSHYLNAADDYFWQYIRAFDDIEKSDFLHAGTIQPADKSLFVFSRNVVDNDNVIITISHSAQVTYHYITGSIQSDKPDGTSLTLSSFYFSSLDPGETVEIPYERTRNDLVNNVDVSKVYIVIDSVYVITP
jgi:hypothetical protein